MRPSTLKTINYSTDNEADLVLHRRGSLWTVGIATGRKIVEIEVTNELAALIGDFLPRRMLADDLLAAAWAEGYQAGHEDARAVQPTYPEPTPNPYRTVLDEGRP